jgi:hypothetical protein
MRRFPWDYEQSNFQLRAAEKSLPQPTHIAPDGGRREGYFDAF